MPTTADADLLTDRQLQMMRLLWRHGSSTVREAKERIEDDLAYTSVLTVFQTLESNGRVYHERDGKAYRYYPEQQRKDVAAEYAGFLREHGLLGPIQEGEY